MRTLKQILILLFISSAFILNAQNKNTNDKDLSIRRSMAAKYLKENYYTYRSAEAKAAHVVMLEAFMKNSEVISINTEKVGDVEDKANLNSFIGGLNSIIILTPTWDDLVKLEKEKLLFEDKASNRTPQLLENKAQQK